MHKEENFINTLFEKTEESKETEVVEPRTTEIVNMSVGNIVPNLKNPYKYREEDMKIVFVKTVLSNHLWCVRTIRLMFMK